jgi:hypothetical protein
MTSARPTLAPLVALNLYAQAELGTTTFEQAAPVLAERGLVREKRGRWRATRKGERFAQRWLERRR